MTTPDSSLRSVDPLHRAMAHLEALIGLGVEVPHRETPSGTGHELCPAGRQAGRRQTAPGLSTSRVDSATRSSVRQYYNAPAGLELGHGTDQQRPTYCIGACQGSHGGPSHGQVLAVRIRYLHHLQPWHRSSLTQALGPFLGRLCSARRRRTHDNPPSATVSQRFTDDTSPHAHQPHLLPRSVLSSPFPLGNGVRILLEGLGTCSLQHLPPAPMSALDVDLRGVAGLVFLLPRALRAKVVASVPPSPVVQAVDDDRHLLLIRRHHT